MTRIVDESMVHTPRHHRPVVIDERVRVGICPSGDVAPPLVIGIPDHNCVGPAAERE